MSPADPKPERAYRADQEEWAKIREILLPRGTRCFCGCGRRADSLHHLVGRDQGGDDHLFNLVPLAGSGTTLCHGAIQYGQRTYDALKGTYVDPHAVAAAIRRNLRDGQIQYIVKRKGWWWLDQHYPKS